MIITVSEAEIWRKEIICKVLEKRLTQKDAAEKLDLGRRQVQRLVNNYKTHGIHGLISKKRGKPSNRKHSAAFRKSVITLVKDYYSHSN